MYHQSLTLTAEEKLVFKALIGQGDALETPPANSTLEVYRTDGSKPNNDSAKAKYQNLLGGHFVSKDTGTDVPVVKKKISIFAKKVWDRADDVANKPEISFQLKNKQTGEAVGEAKVIQTQAGQSEATVQWDDLAGEVSDYTVEELTQLDGYTTSPTQGSGTEDNPFTITNTKRSTVPEYVQTIQVNKAWTGEGLPAAKPDVYFALYKRTNGAESLVTATDVPAVKVNPQKWQGSPVVWRNIYAPGQDQVTGATIEYFVKEVNADGSDWSAPNYLAPTSTYALSGTNSLVFNFTNTYQPTAPKPTTHDVVISKTNLGGQEIAGAQIEIRKGDQKVESWTSEADKSHTVKLEAGEYVFHEEAAPAGYLKVTDITFTVDDDGNVTVKTDTTTTEKSKTEGNKLTVVDEAEVVKPVTHDIIISKTNLGGQEIAGAQIEIRKGDQKVESWTSEADKSHTVKLEAGEYVFHEEAAPAGYLKVTDITFTVDNDGNVTVKTDTTTAAKSKTEGNKLTVIDEAEVVKPVTHDVVISKTNLGGQEIAGAQIEIRKDGQTVESWTSEADKSHTVKLEAGEYVFHEEVAPAGYLKVTDITFTVGTDGNVTVKTDTTTAAKSKTEGNKLTVVDEAEVVKPVTHDVVISKTNLGGQEIAGAQIEIRKDGQTVESWTSEADKSHTVKLEAGEYVFHEEAAPAGYLKVTDITFTVDDDGNVTVKVDTTTAAKSQTAGNKLTVVDEAEVVKPVTHDVVISKTNLGGQEIAGAQIEIRKDGQTVESWTSEADKSHTVKLEAGEYVFHEEAAPAGYLKVTDITFTVDDDGNVTVKVDTTTAAKSQTAGNKLTVVDEAEVVKPVTHDVVISKTNLGGQEIAGAQIEIRKGGQTVESWTSEADKSHTVKLEAGEYVFHEEAAPTGYLKVTDITFTVGTDGNVTVKTDTTTAAKSKTAGNKLTVVDEAEVVKPVTHDVVISKTNLGGQEIAGAQIEIRKDGQTVESWTSEADKSHTVKLEAGEYVFHEEAAPAGYLKVTDITFTVGTDGNVTVKTDTTTAAKSQTAGNKLTVVDEAESQPVEPKPTPTSKEEAPTQNGGTNTTTTKKILPRTNSENATILTMVGFGLLVVLGFSYLKKVND
ncbi:MULTISPECIES: SpaA isopeptide-forming pilin-related protein [unclassified Streptococcus]|uniref:SpaA isopeptide-forming pilin-related protein n=1 Tax=unclassified Streptococcus TaxID=2608887 RepID=UPI00211B3957|nr:MULTISPECIES: SpaA isopeptide-forming pilin-related protein [unclassified Streptococcus]MCQ9211429.1 LPXTG cell wall anchor domain-containing protein [Streptococcus sp. B01]